MASAELTDHATPALRARGLQLQRGGRQLFAGLDFTVPAGGALIVTGPNGAGKSSLLRLVAGLLEPGAGELDNPFPTALLGPDMALKRDRPLRQELAFWADLDGATSAEVTAAAAQMGIAELLDLPVTMLSAGQRQRAAISRMMASGAALWLLDEPTNALDQRATHRLLDAIAHHRSTGGLILAATHQPLPLPDARQLALG